MGISPFKDSKLFGPILGIYHGYEWNIIYLYITYKYRYYIYIYILYIIYIYYYILYYIYIIYIIYVHIYITNNMMIWECPKTGYSGTPPNWPCIVGKAWESDDKPWFLGVPHFQTNQNRNFLQKWWLIAGCFAVADGWFEKPPPWKFWTVIEKIIIPFNGWK